ncbi:ribose-phosphate diphosphokinase [Oceanidesulfovibrio marinus]|uniref:Ribose-phosphate pyrophosphokinase n=1 Tax=Oceanidesulfovibrio marinus TaxID=370038 RepID=A0A6P1ZM53_9BACT|nr:ribose-phosphate pyrophosphokinase [Oceanidesulfovibrio marinus]QJT08245.1 ribose-phosphate pyrophosphokinase [Oceanidesulfovibrio marinus]TVM35138.1 phosphoribosylpyrophosphate synthetase [Oceanidesulfovibrio marinus]
MTRDLKIITGSANPMLAQAICDHLGCRLTPTVTETFSDGEIRIEIRDNVRGDDVFIVQPTCAPVNYHLMQLCLILDALKRASAGRVTAVVPYYGYARQDRKVVPRAPISAKLVADFLTVAGMSRLITIDLHAGQIQGFFDLPVDNLYALPVFLEYLRKVEGDLVMVSPDAGGVERARAYAKRLGATLAIVDKRRDEPNKAKAMHVIGDVKGKMAVVLDDMIDTAGTMVSAADVLLENGAKEVMACATHPVLSGPAVERLCNSQFSKVIVTNTIPVEEKQKACNKLEVLSVAGLLAKSIHNIHTESSVSVLFV